MSQAKNIFQIEFDNFLKLYEPYQAQYFAKKKSTKGKLKAAALFWADLEQFMQGGKKLRGFLTYLGYLASGGEDISKILPVSLAYEIVHSFLLMHDDVIDRSDIRRGKASIHKKYSRVHGNHFGESIAIVWGDIAAFEAMSLVCDADFDDKTKLRAIKSFVETIISTGLGEGIDVLISQTEAKEADICEVNILKTAKYSVSGPLVIGAILARAKADQLKAMEKFGLAAGEAFQIQDDLLGVFGKEEVVGKSVLSDMREGKSTLLMLKTRNLAKGLDKKIVSKVWGNSKATLSDLEKIRQIVKRSGAYDLVISAMDNLGNKALNALKSAKLNERNSAIFSQMAEFFVSRNF